MSKIFTVYERRAKGRYIEIERVSKLAQVDLLLQTLSNGNPSSEYLAVWGDIVQPHPDRSNAEVSR